MESANRVCRDPTALHPAINAALREQNGALAPWVDLIFETVAPAREVDRYLNDWLKRERGVVDVYPEYPDLDLRQLSIWIERQNITRRRCANILH
ncbi:hypothetical protein D3C85_1342060 [compost metagenome]